ncbi:major facilitator superfamily domain-containing protein [Leptodontidium sp. MPI-SDFR-AT-0119]|nr:major facilitator superfamily domain-containing protein [Leptodontidium sp. MPI-SDFR-AT-0119]
MAASTDKVSISNEESDGQRVGELNTDYHIAGIRIPRYRTPMAQVAMVGLIAFTTVGMSSALSGIGGGGLLNTYQSTNANVAIYSTFAALAFFGGTIYNRVGIKVCLMFGGFGYACLSSAYFLTAHIGNRATGWIVAAGCIEGLSAAMLWTAQGAVTMGYPTERMKGRSFSVFWTIFQMGGVIGSILPMAMNWNSKAGTINDGSFIAFIVIMLCGCLIPLLLIPSDQVIREDGTRVVLPPAPTWQSELKGMYRVMRENLWFLSLFPFFAASNWFYTYQRNDFNAPNFTLRTRSFNGLCSNLFNMLGVWLMGTMLDFPFKSKRVTRVLRARVGIVSLLILTMSIWGGGYVFVKDTVRGVVPHPLIDLTESDRYTRYIMMYIFWSLYDGAFQAYAYWLMGSLSNNSATLSHYSGWYKSIQSAAAAIVWRLDGLKVSYKNMYFSTWFILTLACCTTFYVAFYRVQEHSTDEFPVLAEEVKDNAGLDDDNGKEAYVLADTEKKTAV